MTTIKANEMKEMLIKIASLYIEKEDELSRLDGVIGDGDHGVTMARGARAVKEKLEAMEDGTNRDYLKAYGRTLVSTLGGAMGPLFGSIFLELSKVCKEKEEMDVNDFYIGLKNGQEKIMDLGGAKVGDKTMVDAIDPVVKSFDESVKENRSLEEAFKRGIEAADKGVQDTIPMRSRRGRSKFLQDKSIGHQDAGATSYYYLILTIYQFITKEQ